MKFIRAYIHPDVQIAGAILIQIVSLLLLLSVMLRFSPSLVHLAIGREEPFWVLLLSVLALAYSGFSALPAALAYKNARIVAEHVEVDAEHADVEADEVSLKK